jgi:hypothetical protein
MNRREYICLLLVAPLLALFHRARPERNYVENAGTEPWGSHGNTLWAEANEALK